MPRRTASKAVSANVKAFLDQDKDDTRLVGAIRQYLVKRVSDDDRDSTVIHPSEMAKESWCDRGTAHRLLKHKPHTESKTSPHMMSVFEFGHEAHAKWQKWLWEMGVLYGLWECCKCTWLWQAVSPHECQKCKVGRGYLRYKEVRLKNELLNIAGHADGWVKDKKGDTLIEIKTIGTGTIRFEQPELLDGSDLDTVWKNIRRPFPSHIRQGQIYMHLSGVHHMTYLYESKSNQQVKEFFVRYNKDLVSPLLDRAAFIMQGVQQNNLPPCPHGGCAECRAYE